MNPYVKTLGAKALIFGGIAAATSVAHDIYKIYRNKGA